MENKHSYSVTGARLHGWHVLEWRNDGLVYLSTNAPWRVVAGPFTSEQQAQREADARTATAASMDRMYREAQS